MSAWGSCVEGIAVCTVIMKVSARVVWHGEAPALCVPSNCTLRGMASPCPCSCSFHLQYLYNLEVYGHKQFTRREKSELSKAQSAVESRVISGALGPLSPLD